jgi:ABC-type polysaccharide/polyol phosphate transport system ATPase subunit
MAAVLRFEHVTKTFVHRPKRMLLRDRLIELVRPSRRPRFEALHDVSFELEPGESLGLIGPNGAGKSTLLNLATGLSEPDAGRIDVRGRVAALLDLTAGYHPDLTGAENLSVQAALMGLSRQQVRERFEKIVEFSGIREFIHEPLRTYSAGMVMRLAFSVAVSADPDILLIDEVLGVGDQAFAAQCLEKIRMFQSAGKTIVVTSHSLELLMTLCEHALWLDHGRVVASGEVKEIAAAYRGGVVPVR